MTKRFNQFSVLLSLAVGISVVHAEQLKTAINCLDRGDNPCHVGEPCKPRQRDLFSEVDALKVKKNASVRCDLKVNRNAWVKGRLNAKDLKVRCGKNKLRPVVACVKCLKNTRGTIGFELSSTQPQVRPLVVRGKGFVVKPAIITDNVLQIPVCYTKRCACDDASSVICTFETDDPLLANGINNLSCAVTNAQDNPNGFNLLIFGLLGNPNLPANLLRVNFVAQCPGC